MKAPPDPASVSFRLRNGTPAVTRLITPADAPHLARGLARLSPEGHAYRFLHYRSRFTAAELHYLTHCDFTDHIALILATCDEHGHELDQIGVARSIRTKDAPELAEVAVVVVDEYQHRGGGLALLRHLSRLAWASGIRRWQAFSLEDNFAVSRLLARLGTEVSRRKQSHGAVEAIYALTPSTAS